MTQPPRSITIALSGETLDRAGISPDLDDFALAEIVDITVKESGDVLALEYQQWVEDHEDND